MSKPDIVSLREYVDTRFIAIAESARLVHEAEQERAHAYKTQAELVAQAIEQRFQAVDTATGLASDALNQKLLHMNEWRSEYDKQRSDFPTRIELAVTREATEKRLQGLEKWSANIDGRMWAIGVGLAVLTLVINIVLHYIP